jgi:hypothetical protein
MTTQSETKSEKKKFYIFEYFLDGYFLKWEQVIGEDIPRYGQFKAIMSKAGDDISARIVGTEKISDNEYRILMDSLS